MAQDELDGPGLLAHLQQAKGFTRLNARLQPALIPVAQDWLAHWAELLVESPRSTAGPLASLLADVVEWDRAHRELGNP